MKKFAITSVTLALLATFTMQAQATGCDQLAKAGLNAASLRSTLTSGVGGRSAVFGGTTNPNGGLGFAMWLTLVDASGRVCAVVTSLTSTEDGTSDIRLGSRVISAQKANTANSFITPDLSLSTANLYSTV